MDDGSMIPGEWLTTFAVAVIGALGVAWARVTGVAAGKKQQGEVTISGQPIKMQKEPRSPTWAEVQALERRVDGVERHLESMRDTQAKQFQQLLEVGHEREIRIRDTIMRCVSELGDKVGKDIRAVHERIDGCQEKFHPLGGKQR